MNDLTPSPLQESMLPPGTTDEQFIAMWLHGKADATQEEYRRDIILFREHVPVPLQQLTLPDLQAYADELALLDIKPATRARRLKSIKSLLSFAQQTGYTRFNVGTMVKVRKLKKQLAERILTEEQVFNMIAGEKSRRNHALLRLLYISGIRVSELCDLTWRDVQPNGQTGQITVFGKGSTTRVIILKSETYQEVLSLRENAPLDSPVFQSRGGGRGKAGGPLDPSQVERIVQEAARRAGIEGNVSPHWLRHAHASHALENGASIALVKETLGHESIETTAGYTHAKPGTSSAMVLKM